MDTSSYNNSAFVGGCLAYPDYASYTNQPTVVAAEQINTLVTSQTTILATASAVSQVTGVYVNGVNSLYPGFISNGPSQNPSPQAPIQEGFTGTVGG